MFFYLTSSLIILLLLLLYTQFKRRYQFWKDLDVPYIEPSFPIGNVSDFFKTSIHFSCVMEKLYRKLKPYGDYGGIYFFGNPVFLVLTPEFAKTILVRDFHYFMDRGIYYNEDVDKLSANIFFLRGQKWKSLREKLSPTFTSAKLKQMFSTVHDVSHRLDVYLHSFAVANADIDIREIFARFTTDVIASCAFGLDIDCINNPDSEFRKMGRKMINFPKTKALKLILASTFQRQARALGIRWNDKDVSEFFMNVVRETIHYRMNATATANENGLRRNDFMQLLIDMMNTDGSNKGDEGLTFEEIAAQAFVFFFGGFETSSTTMIFCMHSLALNENIQNEARESIKNILVKYNGHLCYEAIMEMTFLGQIIEETLRMYPPVSDIHRWTSRAYRLPNGKILPKETAVIIPTLAFSRDPDIFPNPMHFNPSRFCPTAKAQRHSFSTLPFGEGNRICIGMRFGLMQMKLALAMLLSKYRFTVCHKTDNPIKINNANLLHGPAGKIFLKIQSI